MMKKVLLSLAVGALMASAAQAATINVGTEATFAPFEFMDEQTKELTGFDMEIIKAVAKEMGDDVRVHNMGFDALIPSLQTGIIDVTVAAMTITPERQKRVDFTDPYYQSGLVIMVRQEDTGKYKDFKSLEGSRLCAQIGTTGAMMAKRVKNAKVTEFNSITEAFMELKTKGCEAVINDKPVVDYYLVRRGDKTVTTVPQVFDAEKLNEGLKRIRANGVYDKIYAKWFGAH